MAYVDGWVIAVPETNKQKFIEHAKKGDAVFMENGATRVFECWGDDVHEGKQTDFRKAVAARPGEKIVFTWQVWPDKASFEAAEAKILGAVLSRANVLEHSPYYKSSYLRYHQGQAVAK